MEAMYPASTVGEAVEAPMVVVAEAPPVGIRDRVPVLEKTLLPEPSTVKRRGKVVVPTDRIVILVVARVDVPLSVVSTAYRLAH